MNVRNIRIAGYRSADTIKTFKIFYENLDSINLLLDIFPNNANVQKNSLKLE